MQYQAMVMRLQVLGCFLQIEGAIQEMKEERGQALEGYFGDGS
jgi:hypothetical protein